VAAGAALQPDVYGAHFQFDGLAAAEGGFDLTEAFVAGVGGFFAEFVAGEVGFDDVAAVEFLLFCKGFGLGGGDELAVLDFELEPGEPELGEFLLEVLFLGCYFGVNGVIEFVQESS
jgi:hypothetical protein